MIIATSYGSWKRPGGEVMKLISVILSKIRQRRKEGFNG